MSRHPLDPPEIRTARVGERTFIHIDDLRELQIHEARALKFHRRQVEAMKDRMTFEALGAAFDKITPWGDAAQATAIVPEPLPPLTLDDVLETIRKMPARSMGSDATIIDPPFHFRPRFEIEKFEPKSILLASYPLFVANPGYLLNVCDVGDYGARWQPPGPVERAYRLVMRQPLDRRRIKRAKRIIMGEVRRLLRRA